MKRYLNSLTSFFIRCTILTTLASCGGSMVRTLEPNKFEAKCDINPAYCEHQAEEHCGEQGFEKIDMKRQPQWRHVHEGGRWVQKSEWINILTFKCGKDAPE